MKLGILHGKSGDLRIGAGVRICIDCGSARIVLTDDLVRCRDCGASHKRRIPGIHFRPGDTVCIAGGDGITYRIERISQDEGGVVRYTLKSESSPISLLFTEDRDSHLESAG